MPVTRSAQKKLKQDKQREKFNLILKRASKAIINKYKKNPNKKLLSQVYTILDKMSKKKVYHHNKVSRLKSRLSKLTFTKKEISTTKINKINKKVSTMPSKS